MHTHFLDIVTAQSRFVELLAGVAEGQEIVLTRDGMPIARITPIPHRIPQLDPSADSDSSEANEPVSDDVWLGKQY